jgi:hypothetical protein
MPRPSKQFVRAVLIGLMLTVGSVQAQVSYFCGMMDEVIHDDCCCADAGIDDVMVADSGEPCCEKSVSLTIDAAADQVQQPNKSIKFESDVDPPDIITSAVEISPQIMNRASLSNVTRSANFHTAGSATYLITQRLRI